MFSSALDSQSFDHSPLSSTVFWPNWDCYKAQLFNIYSLYWYVFGCKKKKNEKVCINLGWKEGKRIAQMNIQNH